MVLGTPVIRKGIITKAGVAICDFSFYLYATLILDSDISFIPK